MASSSPIASRRVGWGTAQDIEQSGTGTPADYPQISVNAAGQAFVVWYQTDPLPLTTSSIWSNRFE
jgi:hypothetical protein